MSANDLVYAPIDRVVASEEALFVKDAVIVSVSEKIEKIRAILSGKPGPAPDCGHTVSEIVASDAKPGPAPDCGHTVSEIVASDAAIINTGFIITPENNTFLTGHERPEIGVERVIVNSEHEKKEFEAHLFLAALEMEAFDNLMEIFKDDVNPFLSATQVMYQHAKSRCDEVAAVGLEEVADMRAISFLEEIVENAMECGFQEEMIKAVAGDFSFERSLDEKTMMEISHGDDFDGDGWEGDGA